MSETRIQVAAHFNIDLTQVIPGAFQFPDTIQVTLAVGDTIAPEKRVLNLVISPDHLAKLEEMINAAATEAQRKAKPASEKPTPVATQNMDDAASGTTAPTATGSSMFEAF